MDPKEPQSSCIQGRLPRLEVYGLACLLGLPFYLHTDTRSSTGYKTQGGQKWYQTCSTWAWPPFCLLPKAPAQPSRGQRLELWGWGGASVHLLRAPVENRMQRKEGERITSSKQHLSHQLRRGSVHLAPSPLEAPAGELLLPGILAHHQLPVEVDTHGLWAELQRQGSLCHPGPGPQFPAPHKLLP